MMAHRRSLQGWVAGGLTACLVFVPVSGIEATETDQYLAWSASLEDAAGPLNAYLNRQLAAWLTELAKKGKVPPCEKMAPKFFHELFPHMVNPRIRHHLVREGSLDRFPSDEVGYFSYLRASVYRKPAFPFILPMARTIQIEGIRMGGDKLGHLLGHGRYYYRRYLQARRKGATVEAAMETAVRWGVRVESNFVGGLVDGIFSHADLEANFQGMRLARHFCEGPQPYLEMSEDGWRQGRLLELSEYMNPGFDESYNNSTYSRFRWKRVKPILLAEYCPRFDSEAVQKRLRWYREIDRPSLSRRLIHDVFQSRGQFLQEEQNVDALCGSPAAGEQTATDPSRAMTQMTTRSTR